MRRALALVGLLALLAPAACSDDGPKRGEARLEVDGVALVERRDGDRDTVTGGADLRRGDRVAMQEGSALMRLSGGTVFELRTGFGDAADTAVLMGDRPELEAGELLVATPGSVDLEADGTKVRIDDGAARLSRAFGMGVASYDADISLDSAGVVVEVPALRQMVVPALGRPPQRPRPISYEDDDTWDLRYLGAAMALGERLDRFGTGLTKNLPEGEGRTPGFFRLVLPGLDDESAFDRTLLEPRLDREPGDNLIGAAIVDLGERGEFADRWSDVFSFRDAGAEWGIVALDQAVRSGPLVGSVEDALNASFEEAAFTQLPLPPGAASATPIPAPGGVAQPAAPTRPGGDGEAPAPSSPTTTSPGPSPTNPLPPTPPVPSTIVPAPPPVLAPVVEPVTDLVDDLVGGLLGGLLGP